MSFRDSWLPNIVIGLVIYLLPGKRILVRRFRALLRTRATIGQLTGISQGTSQSYGTLHNAPPSPPKNTLITPSPGSLSLTMSKVPEPMPPGTASAIAMAMQPPPQRPQFLNNSHTSNWQQVFAYQQQLDAAARFAMQATMPKYNHALTP